MSEDNSDGIRRSPLCSTCGDINIKNPTYRILVYILLLVIVGIATFFSFYTFSDINIFLLVFPIIIVGITIFTWVIVSGINRDESK